MIENAKNKELTVRDTFIIEKAKKGFTPLEILVLCEREGIDPPVRSHIYHILKKNGVNIKGLNYLKK